MGLQSAHCVPTIYVDSSNGKTYTRHLLRESYRENGKVRHRTIANISKASPEKINAIRLALRRKGDLQQLPAAARISLPDAPPSKGVAVTTKKKLPERRKKR